MCIFLRCLQRVRLCTVHKHGTRSRFRRPSVPFHTGTTPCFSRRLSYIRILQSSRKRLASPAQWTPRQDRLFAKCESCRKEGAEPPEHERRHPRYWKYSSTCASFQGTRPPLGPTGYRPGNEKFRGRWKRRCQGYAQDYTHQGQGDNG